MLDEGVKQAVSRVWPPRHRGNSGTANTAAPKDSTTRATKDGPVWFHCSAPAVRYEGKRGADSAHANHSENEPSIKGLINNIVQLYYYFQKCCILVSTCKSSSSSVKAWFTIQHKVSIKFRAWSLNSDIFFPACA